MGLWALCILEGVACVGTGKLFIRSPLCKGVTGTEHMEILTWITDPGSLCSSHNMLCFMKLADISRKNEQILQKNQFVYYIFYFTFYISCIYRGFAEENGSTGCVICKVWEQRCEQMLMLGPQVQNSLFDILLAFQEKYTLYLGRAKLCWFANSSLYISLHT